MPISAQSSSKTAAPGLSNPAVARCAKAWERAYQRYLSAPTNHDKAAEDLEFFASEEGEVAFRNALPPLSGEDNIRDFIACVAYALVREILLPIVCTNYFEAAKVALSAARVHRRQPRSGPAQ